MLRRMRRWALTFLLCAACATPAPSPSTATATPAVQPPARDHALPAETHLADLRQLTVRRRERRGLLVVRRQRADPPGAPARRQACDRIFRLPLAADGRPAPAMLPVSSGRGAHDLLVLPARRPARCIYASTHPGGAPARPARPQPGLRLGALPRLRHLPRRTPTARSRVRLTDTPGYDAEATVCGKDGSIVFTSVRDGDLELYRMDADGKNVRRLTHDARLRRRRVLHADCTKIVWRASRPKPGKELDDYKRLLAQGLVRPTQARALRRQRRRHATRGRSPTSTPRRSRPVLPRRASASSSRRTTAIRTGASSTCGRSTSTARGLERITAAPGFDGFPMFSPDGKRLAFASNRATAPGKHDTNVFVADWKPDDPLVGPRAADARRRPRPADVRWLADPAREGRGIGNDRARGGGRATSRSASSRSASSRPATTAATARRSRCARG